MPIIHSAADCPQGSISWYKARLGVPTASEFDKIVTPNGDISDQSRAYAFKLIAEILLKEPMESLEGLRWMERGQELEPEAIKFYEFENDLKTEEVGFIAADDGQAGASPDRLAGLDGMLEIKCPSPPIHVSYMYDGIPIKYRPQLQGQLLIAERKWVDWFSFHPALPPVCIRVNRDEEYISKLDEALDQFITMKNEMLLKIREQGFFAERDRITLIGEREAAEKLNQIPLDALEDLLPPINN